MKTLRLLSFLLAYVSCIAGEFINLDFDSVDSSHNRLWFADAYTGSVSYLLPGWTVQTGPSWSNQTQTTIGYSTAPGGFFFHNHVGVAPSDGGTGFSVGLSPESFDSSSVPVRISQTGVVPTWANQLDIEDIRGPILVGLNGDETAVLSRNQSIDISQFSGRDLELSFRIVSSFASIGGVRFVSVPEPDLGWMALLGVGSCCWWSWRRRNGL